MPSLTKIFFTGNTHMELRVVNSKIVPFLLSPFMCLFTLIVSLKINLLLSSSRINESIKQVIMSVFFRKGRDSFMSMSFTYGVGVNSIPISNAAFEPTKSHVQMCKRSILIFLFDSMKYVLFIRKIISNCLVFSNYIHICLPQPTRHSTTSTEKIYECVFLFVIMPSQWHCLKNSLYIVSNKSERYEKNPNFAL